MYVLLPRGRRLSFGFLLRVRCVGGLFLEAHMGMYTCTTDRTFRNRFETTLTDTYVTTREKDHVTQVGQADDTFGITLIDTVQLLTNKKEQEEETTTIRARTIHISVVHAEGSRYRCVVIVIVVFVRCCCWFVV